MMAPVGEGCGGGGIYHGPVSPRAHMSCQRSDPSSPPDHRVRHACQRPLAVVVHGRGRGGVGEGRDSLRCGGGGAGGPPGSEQALEFLAVRYLFDAAHTHCIVPGPQAPDVGLDLESVVARETRDRARAKGTQVLA